VSSVIPGEAGKFLAGHCDNSQHWCWCDGHKGPPGSASFYGVREQTLGRPILVDLQIGEFIPR
jgi:hypothetical protein